MRRSYLSKGYNFQLNWLKFGGNFINIYMYMSKETPWGHINVSKAKHAFYTMKDVKKIGSFDRCSWGGGGGGGNNKLNMCS